MHCQKCNDVSLNYINRTYVTLSGIDDVLEHSSARESRYPNMVHSRQYLTAHSHWNAISAYNAILIQRRFISMIFYTFLRKTRLTKILFKDRVVA